MRIQPTILFPLLVCILGFSPDRVAFSGSLDGRPQPRVYALDKESVLEEGCFDPCMCPIMLREGLTGKFALVPEGWRDGFLVFRVPEIVLTVPEPYGRKATGSGTYRVCFHPQPLQRMELDLVVGDQPVTRYDSGLVPVRTPYPHIAVRVARHGFYCFDTVFGISASLVPSRPFPPGGPRNVQPLDEAPEPDPVAVTWGRIKALYGAP